MRFPLFAGASEASLAGLRAGSSTHRYRAEERIIAEGDDSDVVYLLESGRVGVFYSSERGVDVLVKVFSAPAVFGEMEIFFDLPRLEYVEAFDDVTVTRITKASFLAFLEAEHAVCLALLRDVAARLCISAYNERALVFLAVEQRLAALLLTFADAYGVADGDGVVLDTKLTYERLAQCLGVAEKSVERAIGKWIDEGWLRREKKRYRIAELSQLEARTDPERLSLHARLGKGPALR